MGSTFMRSWLQGKREGNPLILVVALLGIAFAGPPATGWETLAKGATTVSCSRAGAEPWCRASGRIAAPPDRVYALLNNFSGHAALFSRIASSSEIAPGVAHQVIRLPFPLSPRDYVVALVRKTEGADRVITFSAINRPDIPCAGQRMDHFAGAFRVHPVDGNTTEFSYLWEGELGPDIPDWALPIAWVAQGRELVEGLRAAAER